MELSAREVSWGAGGRVIVDGVSFSVPAGSVTGLLGPNGAGKSSLLRLLAGVAVPDGGAVLADGADVHRAPRRERARTMALLEQETHPSVPLTVLDVVLLGRIPHRSGWSLPRAADDAHDDALARTHLAKVGLGGFDGREFSTLSGGERQRVQVARALAQEPRILLLDEPTNHLDVAAQLSLLSLVRGLGLTTVAALHDLNLAAGWCDHVVVLDSGRVVADGAPREVLTPELIERVYGVRSHVLEHPGTGRPLIAFDPPGP
ncbi:MAG: ATP-binding cassette domain-containing protein [Actinomycetota bacterium]|nr:ATP-binding cassette domain-containing protein [Actinomycetota bacterium]